MDERDLTFVQTPRNWPRWPICRLVNRMQSVPRIGVLIERGVMGPEPIVYLVNMNDLMGEVDLNKLDKMEFDSFEDLLEDGWEVD